MSITVEHDKRKREILEKALDVFVIEGYEDTTFQKIAERCGITRTILYLYFKNKREIFTFSIKLFAEKLETELRHIAADPALSQSEKLSSIISMVIETCATQARLLSVIMNYLGHLRASGGDADERVRRRTIRLRHLLAGILIEGQRKGEFTAFPIKLAGNLLYSIIEAAIFRIAVLGKADIEGLQAAVSLLVEGFGRGILPQGSEELSGGKSVSKTIPGRNSPSRVGGLKSAAARPSPSRHPASFAEKEGDWSQSESNAAQTDTQSGSRNGRVELQ